MPTIKQKLAFKAIGENGGIISKAMETAGYSPTITHATEKLTNSQGWKELMDEYLPDTLLAKKHRALLEKIDKEGEIDTTAVSKGLEMGYKIKKRFDGEGININFNLINISLEEKEAINKAIDAL